jgi:hypothetical protein
MSAGWFASLFDCCSSRRGPEVPPDPRFPDKASKDRDAQRAAEGQQSLQAAQAVQAYHANNGLAPRLVATGAIGYGDDDGELYNMRPQPR